MKQLFGCRKLVRMIYQLLISIAILCLPLASSVYAANLLTNPGFETGDFTGWTVGGNSYSNGVGTNGTPISGAGFTSYIITRTGNYAGYAVVDGQSAMIHRITLTQTVSVPPQTDIPVGFWMGCKTPDNDTFGVGIFDNATQIFIDGVGVLPNGTVTLSSCIAGNYMEFSSSFNTGNRTSVQVTYAITGSGEKSAGFSFDDFYVNAPDVPPVQAIPTMTEWGMIIFMAIAGIGAVYYLRRQKRA